MEADPTPSGGKRSAEEVDITTPLRRLLILVINLDHRPGRLPAMHTLLNPLVTPWRRVSTVDDELLMEAQCSEQTPAAIACARSHRAIREVLLTSYQRTTESD